MRLIFRACLPVLAGLLLGASSLAVPASAATTSSTSSVSSVTVGQHVAAKPKPKPKKYKNCRALHKVYKHGVGRKGAHDKVKGKHKPVTNFTISTKTYKLNKKKLDRDKDGVACEKH